MDEALEWANLEWAQAFSGIARELSQLNGVDAVLRRIAELATVVAGCPWAAIARSTTAVPAVAATSDPAIGDRIAAMQSAAGGGPTWHAVEQGETIYVPDLAAETRWPDHMQLLLTTTPVRSILVFCLDLGSGPLGALTLYGDRPQAFPEPVLAAATVYADHAAIALDNEQTDVRAQNLETALRSNREIGIAIGVLIERHKITDEQAFDLLRSASQRTHRKLRDIAAGLVLTGELPTQ